MAESIEYIGFHGTDKKSQALILKHNHYKPSDSDNEWAGTGVYYFWDDGDEIVASRNAYKWSKYYKYFEDPAVIRNRICVEQKDKVLNLCDTEVQRRFHQFRDKLFADALRRADRQGKMLQDLYRDPTKLDCLTINLMAEKINIDLIIKSVFINFSKQKYGKVYTPSSVPNCTIICLRNQELIQDWRDYHVG